MLWLVNVQIFAIVKFITFATWCAYVSSLYALSVFIFINSIAFLALTKPTLFVMKQKYAKSPLANNEKDILFNELVVFLNTRKSYLDPSLTLKKLSEDLNMPVKWISQVINEKHNQNFNDFINTFRIEESKKYIRNTTFANMTIQEIFYKSGFNSKSTFNLIFKKQTGYTPLEYRRQFTSS
jgi:AraC-like DNA-binding protein